jgi:Rab3 GTPase-activating protein catalytic subunit
MDWGRAGWEEAEVVVRERRSSRVLRSDMQAFKAANPSALLSDFILWHSLTHAPVPPAQIEVQPNNPPSLAVADSRSRGTSQAPTSGIL